MTAKEEIEQMERETEAIKQAREEIERMWDEGTD